MANLADIIEEFILRKMAGGQDEIVILRRNEMAEEIECAPSQISYVLSTRFTIARGFVVESRRGSGGFVRIARIPLQNIIYEDVAKQLDDRTSFGEFKAMVERLAVQGLLSQREAMLFLNFSVVLYERMIPQERVAILRTLLLALADFA